MSKPSRAGSLVLRLIMQGTDTEEALGKAAGMEPEDVARALAGLARRKLITRNWRDGEMHWQAADD